MRFLYFAQLAPHPEQCVHCGEDIIHEAQTGERVWVSRLNMETIKTEWYNLPCGHVYYARLRRDALTPEEIAAAYLMVQND